MQAGKYSNLLHLNTSLSEEFRKKMAHINKFMKSKNLPTDLRDRIRKYYLHLWSRQSIISFSHIY